MVAAADCAPTWQRVVDVLRVHHGEPAPRTRIDPLDELVATILSQNTSDRNTERSFASLKARFPTWEVVRTAPVEQVVAAIEHGGLAQIKAPRIQRVLDRIRADRGALDLSFLDAMSVDDGRAYLTALNGVGPKTAACVLLFSLGKPALPVDTHVHRVSKRLGLIGARTTAERAHAELERMVAPDAVYAFHMLLIVHGRRVCHAQRPACDACPLSAECPRVDVDSPIGRTRAVAVGLPHGTDAVGSPPDRGLTKTN
jgi:endonuclease-3